MTRTILDIHILQTVPPSNLNRDDTGTPKTAVYGGKTRARVSSQAWKRATRQAFSELLDPSELGVRTKRVAEVVAERMAALDPSVSPEDALKLAADTVETATGSKMTVPKRNAKDADAAPESSYLMFLSRRQLDALAALAIEGGAEGGPAALKTFFQNKENKARARQAVDTRHSVDIALFGRMVANSTDLNVDAAVQVAHALSVHAVEIESDYYTAVDDRNADDEMGAGMIGSVDFNSATLYRYAAVDVDRLRENLGSVDEAGSAEPIRRAVTAFLEGFVSSLPTGKINTFGNHTLPAAVVVKLRTRRPISFVAAFERPVGVGEEGGFVRKSCDRLAAYVPGLERAYGLTDTGQSWVLRFGEETEALAALGTEVALPELLDAVGSAVAARLEVKEVEEAGESAQPVATA
ncbi:type I-E CRISPR-associated protein Cas7/Cse4/CasC [Streptomyces yaizuensis]|uniref:Type I-E CRISPR-associated protein Cas7/Cse4/CasC n=1 Tax=Streptomyces yaizuensis TaxID=2989713 RepID=A0ABQ5P826_9ACTN|nr:type I-E CRISPR-associated protein Cas7/Cse4/CasC [Streptomyces sp. YSPA8]GLF98746.1 type I-E CRISPR-associated protein Cas7/Cse4/CasC [Streptomyces sp. YSPA8]